MSARSEPLRFDEESHTYTKGGVLVPNVTGVLEVLDTYAGIPLPTLRRAAIKGTAVHRATELDDQGILNEDSVHDALWPYLLGWRQFRQDTGFRPTMIEERVFHAKHWYAGTLDRTGLLDDDGKEVMIDIKSTAQLMPSTGPQLAAYREARNQGRRDKINRTFAVQVKDDGSYTMKEYNDRADFGVFLGCLAVHNWKTHHNGRST